MASFKIDLTNITADNKAVRDISEAVFLSLLEPGKLDTIFDINLGVRNGQKIAFIKPMGEIAKAIQGCSPTYGTDSIPASEITWEVSGFGIYEKLCANDLMGTLAKAMRDNGVDSDNMLNDFYVQKVLIPILEEKILDEIFRVCFFGDPALTVYNSSTNSTGKLKSTKTAANWTFMTGVWKRIEAGVSSGTIKKVSISENATATYALQDAFVTTSGSARHIISKMKYAASTELRTASDRQIICTQSFQDAIEYDLMENYKGSELHYQDLFGGIKVTNYAGEKLVIVPQLDRIIQSSFVNTDYPAAANYLPHRAIFYSKQIMKWGTESGGFDNKGKIIPSNFADMKIWYDEKSEEVYFKVKDTMGTAIYDDNLVVAAY